MDMAPDKGAASLSSSESDLPPVSALFLIEFDVKAGYTISWRRQSPAPDVPGAPQLDGLVEYKSLPSGLHTVAEDLVYFVHEASAVRRQDDAQAQDQGQQQQQQQQRSHQGYAGLSAFVNVPCDDEGARHARMIAVGVLVPLSFGRLGRAWRHAEGLKKMAAQLANDRHATPTLERYWDQHRPKGILPSIAGGETPIASPGLGTFQPLRVRGHVRQRSASDGSALAPLGRHKLSPYHPAWSLTRLLDVFGPLIFPIHRAALLRQRILISGHVPVFETCNFVYSISVLSNIPLAASESITPPRPAHRLRPLFNISVHDIPFLTEDSVAAKRRAETAPDPDDDGTDDSGTGWVACTTDSILAIKDTLWDMLITMPAPHSSRAQEKAWPTVECPRGVPVKATQRDLRRYRTLRAGLSRHFGTALASSPARGVPETPGVLDAEPTGIRMPDSNNARDDDDEQCFDDVVEPASWASLAYNGFMWWASAGEQLHATEQDEAAHDSSLLSDLAPAHSHTMTPTAAPDDGEARKELAIIAYFHRLTAQMLRVLAGQINYDDRYELPPYTDTDPSAPPHPSFHLPVRGSTTTVSAAGPVRDDSDAEEGDFLLQPRDTNLDNDDDDLDNLDDGEIIPVDARVFREMGLDLWSRRDAEFIAALVKMYFGRETCLEGKGVEVCGVRVC